MSKGKLHLTAASPSQEHLLFCENQAVFQEQECSIWMSLPVEYYGAKTAGTMCS